MALHSIHTMDPALMKGAITVNGVTAAILR
jgi:hypothetical protein